MGNGHSNGTLLSALGYNRTRTEFGLRGQANALFEDDSERAGQLNPFTFLSDRGMALSGRCLLVLNLWNPEQCGYVR